jgi:hypothetical protein
MAIPPSLLVFVLSVGFVATEGRSSGRREERRRGRSPVAVRRIDIEGVDGARTLVTLHGG